MGKKSNTSTTHLTCVKPKADHRHAVRARLGDHAAVAVDMEEPEHLDRTADPRLDLRGDLLPAARHAPPSPESTAHPTPATASVIEISMQPILRDAADTRTGTNVPVAVPTLRRSDVPGGDLPGPHREGS